MLISLPFSYHWILKRAIGKDIHSILDLGCGEGDLMQHVSVNQTWAIYGVELFNESVKKAKATRVYKNVFRGDVIELPQSLNHKKFDAVFSSQVIEHLSKKDGEVVLKKWEKLAKRRIVVSTPVGFMKYHRIEGKKEDNPLQKHLSGWSVDEFRKKGYTVRGQGARFIYGENGIARKIPSFLFFFSFINYLLSPIIYFFPKLATYMVSWKNI